MTSRALIAGATGLIGSNLAEHLLSKGWEVYGVARKPQTGIPGVRPVAADLLEREALRASLAGIYNLGTLSVGTSAFSGNSPDALANFGSFTDLGGNTGL